MGKTQTFNLELNRYMTPGEIDQFKVRVKPSMASFCEQLSKSKGMVVTDNEDITISHVSDPSKLAKAKFTKGYKTKLGVGESETFTCDPDALKIKIAARVIPKEETGNMDGGGMIDVDLSGKEPHVSVNWAPTTSKIGAELNEKMFNAVMKPLGMPAPDGMYCVKLRTRGWCSNDIKKENGVSRLFIDLRDRMSKEDMKEEAPFGFDWLGQTCMEAYLDPVRTWRGIEYIHNSDRVARLVEEGVLTEDNLKSMGIKYEKDTFENWEGKNVETLEIKTPFFCSRSGVTSVIIRDDKHYGGKSDWTAFFQASFSPEQNFRGINLEWPDNKKKITPFPIEAFNKLADRYNFDKRHMACLQTGDKIGACGLITEKNTPKPKKSPE